MAYDGVQIKMIDGDSFLLAHPLVRPCVVEMKDGRFRIVPLDGSEMVKDRYIEALEVEGGG